MKKQIKIITTVFTGVALTLGLTLTSCKKGDTGPAGTAGTNGTNGMNAGNTTGTGKIVGTLGCSDGYGQPLSIDQTTKIFIPNTTFSTNPSSTGGYTISGIPLGVYTLYFQCNNYATQNQLNLPVGNNNTTVPNYITLSKLPTWSFVNLSCGQQSAGQYTFVATSNSAGLFTKRYIYLFSNNPSINISNPIINYFGGVNNTGTLSSTDVVSLNIFTSKGFSVGQTIFIKAYPTSNIGSNMIDTITGQNIINNYNVTGASPTNSFVL